MFMEYLEMFMEYLEVSPDSIVKLHAFNPPPPDSSKPRAAHI